MTNIFPAPVDIADEGEDEDTNDLLATRGDIRAFALFCSVLRHGFANFSGGAIPSKDHSVIKTADHFADYIHRGTNTAPTASNSRNSG